MTTFKQFLLETDDDLSAFKGNAKIMLDNNILLYRGTNSLKTSITLGNRTGFIASERTIERVAKGNKVAANLAAKWEIPKRALAYFATRDAAHADQFGHLLLVIPADNVSQFAWMGTDFNQAANGSFNHSLEMLDSKSRDIINYMRDMDAEDNATSANLLKLITDAGIDPTKIDRKTAAPDSPDGLKLVNIILSNPSALEDDFLGKYFIKRRDELQKIFDKHDVKTPEEFLAMASPKTMRIKTFDSLDKIPKRLATPDELWFNGRYLAINLDSRYHTPADMHKILQAILES